MDIEQIRCCSNKYTSIDEVVVHLQQVAEDDHVQNESFSLHEHQPYVLEI